MTIDLQRFDAEAGNGIFVIAEAGVNHNGELKLALELVDAARAAGCDAIKFQTWITDKVYSRSRSLKPDYQLAGTAASESEYDTIRRLELSHADFARIKAHCDRTGILFFSTPDEGESARFLAELGVTLMKTASQDVTNLPFLRDVASLGLPVIYSTGACTMAELAAGVEAIRALNPNLAILHCVSSYPAPLDQMNLKVIPVLRSMFGLPVGFSDHTTGIEAACAALALGARIFEKHLTLDRALSGPDHQASLMPEEMARYTQTLRALEGALGDGHKRIMPCEENTRLAFRRYIVVDRALAAGHRLGAADISFKKVGAGLDPSLVGLVLGARLKQGVAADTPVQFAMLDWA